jgi:uncharacterized protein YndB with AHSA1/START domain
VPVTNIYKDLDGLTMTLTAEFDAAPERIWQLWADPRQLERWWGPPQYPATVDSHDLRPGGRVAYHMTGPSGDQPHGLWEVVEVDPPRTLVFQDRFADDEGNPRTDMPALTARVTIDGIGGGRSQMTIRSEFASRQAMEQMLTMGMEEGIKSAVAQIDAILAVPTTRAIEAPGATLVYDVRTNAASKERLLMLIGSPMGASGFAELASRFADRTVVTYDPRGTERSHKADPAAVTGPPDHAEDVHRVIEAVGGGPVDLFASSGGAINGLALVAAHPEDVRTLVDHEPPIATSLPDGEYAGAAVRAIHETYMRSGWGAVHRRRRCPARPRPAVVRHAHGRRRHAHRPAARAEHGRDDQLRA